MSSLDQTTKQWILNSLIFSTNFSQFASWKRNHNKYSLTQFVDSEFVIWWYDTMITLIEWDAVISRDFKYLCINVKRPDVLTRKSPNTFRIRQVSSRWPTKAEHGFLTSWQWPQAISWRKEYKKNWFWWRPSAG